MRPGQHGRIWAGAAALSALALAGTARQRRHMRRIAEDPGREALEHPLAGNP